MSIPAALLERTREPEDEIVRIPMSLEDYLNLPEPPIGDFKKVEWIGGVALFITTPTFRHSRISGNIYVLLRNALPKAQVFFDGGLAMSYSRRVPDILVTRKFPDDEHWEFDPPLICVEVASPSTWREDLGPKVREYAEAGTQQYWTVDVETQTVTVRRNNGNGWDIEAILDSQNSAIEIDVVGVGTVQLRIDELFAE